MSQLPDPIQAGLQRGWKVRGAEHGALPGSITVDVAIVGSGAGGGITAELLSRAGLSVLVIEEGPLRSSSQFKQRESEAYPQLYQESAGRKTFDKAINILQGGLSRNPRKFRLRLPQSLASCSAGPSGCRAVSCESVA